MTVDDIVRVTSYPHDADYSEANARGASTRARRPSCC
jgi:hypothetical protein